MKPTILLALCLPFICLIVFLVADPEQGHHGSGHASRGSGQHAHTSGPRSSHNQAAHINRNISRSPSMSRSDSRPRSTVHIQQVPRRAHPAEHHRASADRSVQSRQQVQQFIRQSRFRQQPDVVGGTTPTPVQAPVRGTSRFHRQQDVVGGTTPTPVQAPVQPTPQFETSWRERRRGNFQAQSRVQEGLNHRHPHFNQWFGDSFFSEHRFHPRFHRNGANWWSAPGWSGVCNWLPWGWQTPIYYDDSGYAAPLTPDDESSYVEQPAPEVPSEVPAEPGIQLSEGDWLPLGVFAAALNIGNAPYSTMFVQLAINKQGDIAGTYYNSTTNETYNLDGEIDKVTQEAVWKVTDDPKSPFMTTGVYNLTQEVVQVQVHFPDSSIQPWVLVRLTK